MCFALKSRWWVLVDRRCILSRWALMRQTCHCSEGSVVYFLCFVFFSSTKHVWCNFFTSYSSSWGYGQSNNRDAHAFNSSDQFSQHNSKKGHIWHQLFQWSLPGLCLWGMADVISSVLSGDKFIQLTEGQLPVLQGGVALSLTCVQTGCFLPVVCTKPPKSS